MNLVMADTRSGAGMQARKKAFLLEAIADIDNQLSPENISWDGERPTADVWRAAKVLLNKRAELKLQLDSLEAGA